MTTIASITPAQLSHGQWLHATGRDAPFDGGGGPLYYDAASTAQADGGIVFAVHGAPGRLLRTGYTVMGYSGDVEAAWFGVRAGAAVDAALALIKASPHVRSEVRLPHGVLRLNAPFTNDKSGLAFIGRGCAAAVDGMAVDQILAASGTVIQAAPGFAGGPTLWVDTAKTTPASAQRNGGGLVGVTLDGAGLADCHAVLGVVGGRFADVLCVRGKAIGLSVGVVRATDGSRIGSCSRNNFSNYDATYTPLGAALWGDSATTSNASLNTFVSCQMRGGVEGWSFGNSDSNWLFGCGGTASTLHAADTCPYSLGEKTRSARANVLVAWQGTITAKAGSGAAPPSQRNILAAFSRENGASLHIEPGARLVVLTDQISPGATSAGQLWGLEPRGLLASCKAGGVALPVCGAWVDVPFGGEQYDHGESHVVGAAAITVPAGVSAARITGVLLFDEANTKGRRGVRVLKNGLEWPGMPSAEQQAGCPAAFASGVVQVAAGDVFTVQACNTSAAAASVVQAPGCWVSVEWL